MKITQIALWRMPLTSHITYYMSEGKSCGTIDTILLRLTTNCGREGWGEVCPIPHYLPAYAQGVAPAIEELAPILIGADPIGPEAVMSKVNAFLKGHDYAKSAIDIALWDLTAKTAGLPLYRLLGGLQTSRLPLYHSITCIDPDEMAGIAREAQRQGITQFQAKLGADNDWQADVARLRLVREAVGEGPLVYGDWNCGAKKLDAIRVGRAVSNIDVMLEQPCATLEDCAQVKIATGLPMKIDENVNDTATLLRATELGCMDAVALKLSKFGGLGALRQARDLCLHLGSKLCIEDTWGSDVAMTAGLHLAAATPPSAVLNVCDLSGYVSPRLDPKVPTRDGGTISIPHDPGLGVAPDMDCLGEPIMIIN